MTGIKMTQNDWNKLYYLLQVKLTGINFTTRQIDRTNLYYIFTTSQIDWNKLYYNSN